MDFNQLKNAIFHFKEMLTAYKDSSAKRSEIEKDAIQDSLVKRFEYTLEVSWKTTKRYLNEEGFLEAGLSPARRTGSRHSVTARRGCC